MPKNFALYIDHGCGGSNILDPGKIEEGPIGDGISIICWYNDLSQSPRLAIYGRLLHSDWYKHYFLYRPFSHQQWVTSKLICIPLILSVYVMMGGNLLRASLIFYLHTFEVQREIISIKII